MPVKKATPTQLAAQRRAIMDQIAELTKQKNALDEKLLALDKDTTYEGDGVVLSFTPIRTLDTDFIAKKYPASKRPEFYKLTLDTNEFKKSFSPIQLESFQKISYRIKVEAE